MERDQQSQVRSQGGIEKPTNSFQIPLESQKSLAEHKKQLEEQCSLFFEPQHRNSHQLDKKAQSSCSIQGNHNGQGNTYQSVRLINGNDQKQGNHSNIKNRHIHKKEVSMFISPYQEITPKKQEQEEITLLASNSIMSPSKQISINPEKKRQSKEIMNLQFFSPPFAKKIDDLTNEIPQDSVFKEADGIIKQEPRSENHTRGFSCTTLTKKRERIPYTPLDLSHRKAQKTLASFSQQMSISSMKDQPSSADKSLKSAQEKKPNTNGNGTGASLNNFLQLSNFPLSVMFSKADEKSPGKVSSTDQKVKEKLKEIGISTPSSRHMLHLEQGFTSKISDNVYQPKDFNQTNSNLKSNQNSRSPDKNRKKFLNESTVKDSGLLRDQNAYLEKIRKDHMESKNGESSSSKIPNNGDDYLLDKSALKLKEDLKKFADPGKISGLLKMSEGDLAKFIDERKFLAAMKSQAEAYKLVEMNQLESQSSKALELKTNKSASFNLISKFSEQTNSHRREESQAIRKKFKVNANSRKNKIDEQKKQQQQQEQQQQEEQYNQFFFSGSPRDNQDIVIQESDGGINLQHGSQSSIQDTKKDDANMNFNFLVGRSGQRKSQTNTPKSSKSPRCNTIITKYQGNIKNLSIDENSNANSAYKEKINNNNNNNNNNNSENKNKSYLMIDQQQQKNDGLFSRTGVGAQLAKILNRQIDPMMNSSNLGMKIMQMNQINRSIVHRKSKSLLSSFDINQQFDSQKSQYTPVEQITKNPEIPQVSNQQTQQSNINSLQLNQKQLSSYIKKPYFIYSSNDLNHKNPGILQNINKIQENTLKTLNQTVQGAQTRAIVSLKQKNKTFLNKSSAIQTGSNQISLGNAQLNDAQKPYQHLNHRHQQQFTQSQWDNQKNLLRFRRLLDFNN